MVWSLPITCAMWVKHSVRGEKIVRRPIYGAFAEVQRSSHWLLRKKIPLPI